MREGNVLSVADRIVEEGVFGALPYRVIRGPLGQLNGYVGVPKTHPWFGHGYSDSLCGHPGCYEHTPDRSIEVHGGLTFASKSESSEFWWFGFDTAHAGDAVPGLPSSRDDTLRDAAYVRKECERMAKQLAEVLAE